MQLRKAINGYLKHMKVYGSAGYYKFNKQQASAVLKHFDEYLEVESLNYKDVYKFIQAQKDLNLKNNTINKRLAFLRRVARFNDLDNDLTNIKELRVNFITYGRVSQADLKTVERTVKRLSLAEQVVYAVFKDTGVRVSELLHMKGHRLDLTTNSITLEVTKSGRERQVFFTDKTKQLILDYIQKYNVKLSNKNVYLFKHLKLNRERINTLFRKIRKQSGVQKLSPHRLRHTLASELYGNGCDILYISRLLGHTNLETTKNYILVNEQKALTIYNKYIQKGAQSE